MLFSGSTEVLKYFIRKAADRGAVCWGATVVSYSLFFMLDSVSDDVSYDVSGVCCLLTQYIITLISWSLMDLLYVMDEYEQRYNIKAREGRDLTDIPSIEQAMARDPSALQSSLNAMRSKQVSTANAYFGVMGGIILFSACKVSLFLINLCIYCGGVGVQQLSRLLNKNFFAGARYCSAPNGCVQEGIEQETHQTYF